MKFLFLTAALFVTPLAQADIGSALNGCLVEGISHGIAKSKISGEPRFQAVLYCTDAAESLYDEVQFFGNSSPSTNDRNQKIDTRFFGDIGSQCQRVYEDANGSPLNEYQCMIFIDLENSLLNVLN